MDNVLIAQEVLHFMGNKSDGRKLMALKLNMERAYDIRYDEMGVSGSCHEEI